MSTAGPNAAGTGANDTSLGTGFDWANTSAITSSNDDRANCGVFPTSASNYLKATNFGFSIPGGSTIDGIVVDVERGTSSGTTFSDNKVRIVKGGAISTTDRSTYTTPNWGDTDATVSYGSSSDLWGETWTAADINDATFGVVFSFYNNDTSFSRTVRVDYVQITIYYTAGATGQPASKRMGGVQFASQISQVPSIQVW